MNGYLLDTNALIGFLFYPDLLSKDAKKILAEASNISVSIMSLWEIGIKQSIGKIDIDASASEIESACNELEITVAPLKPSYIDSMRTLPSIHRDPFDRIIIAQAITDNLTIVTKDSIIFSSL